MNESPISRSAVSADAAAVGRVSVEAWRAAYAGLMPAEFLAGLDQNDIASRFEQAIGAGFSILVLELDTTIVGFSVLGKSRDSEAPAAIGEVIAINLLPAYWRRGLGRILLDNTLQ